MARPNARISKEKREERKLVNQRKKPKDSIDVIISSGRIRNLFLERCDELKVSPYVIASMVGINEVHFKENYIHKVNPKQTYDLTQEKMIKALKVVGIDVRVLLSVTSIEKHKEWLKTKGITLKISGRYDPDTKFNSKSKWC